jgi:hypothetical protein
MTRIALTALAAPLVWIVWFSTCLLGRLVQCSLALSSDYFDCNGIQPQVAAWGLAGFVAVALLLSIWRKRERV